MKKFRSFINFDREESWLNEMAAQGYFLTRVGLRYEFDKTTSMTPEAVSRIRVDYQQEMNDEDFIDYVALFEDAGWQHIAGNRKSGAQYFAATSAAGPEIFSDERSKAQRYRRAITRRAAAVLMFMFLTFSFIYSGALSLPSQDWYFTPGLWDMRGASFLGAFAFETLFVFVRNMVPWLLALMGLVLLWQTLRQSVLWIRARRFS